MPDVGLKIHSHNTHSIFNQLGASHTWSNNNWVRQNTKEINIGLKLMWNLV